MGVNGDKSAIIAGVGPALGSSLCGVFCQAGYTTLGLSRTIPPQPDAHTPPHSGKRVLSSPASAANCVRKAANAGDFKSLKPVIEEFLQTAPPLKLAVYNAAKFLRAPFEDTSTKDFMACWQTNFLGAVHFSKLVIPPMLKHGGTLIFSGATASIRGGADFSAFASSKFALRGLAQSLARTYHPKGVHVAHVVLDGAIAGS